MQEITTNVYLKTTYGEERREITPVKVGPVMT